MPPKRGRPSSNEVQSGRSADGLLRDLGAAYFATLTGRATPTTEADITRLVAAIHDHEAAHGALTLAPETAAAAADGSAGRFAAAPTSDGAAQLAAPATRGPGRLGPASASPRTGQPGISASAAPNRADAVGAARQGATRSEGYTDLSSPRGGAVW